MEQWVVLLGCREAKWGAGLGGFLGTGVRLTGVGTAECLETGAAVGH